jgi:hypothetical protein
VGARYGFALTRVDTVLYLSEVFGYRIWTVLRLSVIRYPVPCSAERYYEPARFFGRIVRIMCLNLS